MLASAANRDSFAVTTPSDEEVRMTRLFDAPPDLVFEVMTRPEHIRQWWGCLGDGYSVPVCEVDLRVGGKWKFVNRHPQGEATFYGEYLEIDRPHRVVFTEIFADFPDMPSTVTSELVAEAKVSYAGTGPMADSTQRKGLGKWIHDAIQWIWPF